MRRAPPCATPQADALAVREELAGRLAAETAAMSAVAVLRGQVEELRVRADARDARDHALAKLAGELAVTARTAREEVERHAAARVQAEAAVEVERKRVAEVEAALTAERDRAAHAEGALRSRARGPAHRARPRRRRAEAEARSARRAELEALTAAGDRLRPVDVAAVPDGLILDLGRAAERLRHGALIAVEVPRRSGLRRLLAAPAWPVGAGAGAGGGAAGGAGCRPSCAPA